MILRILPLPLDREINTGREGFMENKKYDRLTKGLVYPLIEKYYRSGDLPSVFYKREGLSESQFYTWRQRYLRDHPAVAKKLGIEVKQGGNGSRRSSKIKDLRHPYSMVKRVSFG